MGEKKEDTPFVDGQTNLFDKESFSEPEHTGQESQEIIEIKGFRRTKSKGKKALSLSSVTRESSTLSVGRRSLSL